MDLRTSFPFASALAVHEHLPSRFFFWGKILLLLVALGIAPMVIGPPQVPAPGLLAEGAAISPEQSIVIGVPFLRASLARAALYEEHEIDGAVAESRSVPIVASTLPASAPWEGTQIRLAQPDGGSPLRPDSSYQLTLSGDWNLPSLLWLKLGTWNASYRFTTDQSPRLVQSDQMLYPRFGQPVALRWNIPLTGFDYRVSPAVETSSALDPNDPSLSYITMRGYAPGQTYRVEVIAADGNNGIPLQHPYSFSVVMPKAPTPTLTEDTLRYGEALKVSWDEPIVAFSYDLDPPVESKSLIDPGDRHQTAINIQPFQQGQEYHLTITGATSENGASLEEPRSFVVSTPPALVLSETVPDDDAFGVSPDQSIAITFSADVGNRSAAERAFSLTPAVDGHFEWASPRKLRFVPAVPLPFQQDITVRLAGGPEGPHDAAGSYLEDDASFTFTVRPDKQIDVDLTHQQLTLLEGGRAVFTTPTATGVRGAETPTGKYMVQYKLPVTRMRGVNPSGSRYDIPDVPWVLAFWDDYTIHGAYWRSAFGIPGSNGCVSLPVPIAKKVYDWSPPGTPIVIHY